ncbi:hypothetical protein FOZ60_017058 [Perkinsus olseni]|uniref:DUF4954 domain-containing protein n=1 Tax=Perkinsus olseni TaxID=32597 RepID=A0A7J6P4I6_PEROL|nr:hypothetical protein FOZ60_017058 [Perkinsus olseni]
MSALPRTRAASFSGHHTPADFVSKSVRSSPFIAALREANAPRTVRPVTAEEVEALEAAGCTADDWANVWAIGQRPLGVKALIKGCSFQGRVEIAAVEGSKVTLDGRRQLGCGIFNTVFEDVVIEEGTLVKDCGLVANTIVRKGAALIRCGVVEGSSQPDCTYANGHTLPLAEETGSRDTEQFAELSIEIAAKVASSRGLAPAYQKAVSEYTAAVEAAGKGKTIVDENAVVLSCSSVKGSYIGRSARVVNSKIRDSALLEGNHVEDCSLTTAILQKEAGVESFGVVEGATLCPTVHVERHGKVFDSIVGPCSGIAEGEVTASLVGPFVGFHHQALLIACFWPAGRGNIGYGANGTFFGLATNIKYPCNLVDSPYSLIATGISCLPQAIGLPFSLVNESTECIAGLSPAINEVTPGRLRILRSRYQYSVFRPDIMDRVVKARDILKAADPKDTKLRDAKGQPVFTDKQIRILGKNWMHESARLTAVKTYTTFLQWYAIRGLWRRLSSDERKMSTGRPEDAAKMVSSTLAYLKSPPAIDLTPLYENLTACAFRDEESQAELRDLQWAHECKVGNYEWVVGCRGEGALGQRIQE